MKFILKNNQRNFGIDLIRAISIWFVLLYHHGINIPGLKFFGLGGLGVEIFFVVSGFLIGNILIRNLESSNTITSIIKFWKRRWFRILPLYYFVLLIRFFLDPSIGIDIFWFVFFLQSNFFEIDFFAVSWSLVIEEWFYLIAPFVLYFSNKFRRNKFNIYFLFALILFINVLRVFYYLNVGIYSAVSSQFILRLDSLFIGVILVFTKIKYKNFYSIISNFKYFIISLFSLICYLTFMIKYGDQAKLFVCTLGFTWLSLHIAMIIPYVEVNIKSFYFNYLSRFVTITSILTYSIYLLHPFVFFDFQNLIIDNFFVKIFITYLISYLLYFTIELPFLKLRDIK